jgi:mono/diheme cytochrome c family protein
MKLRVRFCFRNGSDRFGEGEKRAVKTRQRINRLLYVAGGLGILVLGGLALSMWAPQQLTASPLCRLFHFRKACDQQPCGPEEHCESDEWEGTWYWLRSPDQEKQIIAGLFSRYCIRCHAADGRGVWDIPGVPDFTNVRWQDLRSDAQRARIILEGRGAVMPPFRGTLTLEEAWAMGRYLRTFVPGSEVSRPETGPSKKPEKSSK